MFGLNQTWPQQKRAARSETEHDKGARGGSRTRFGRERTQLRVATLLVVELLLLLNRLLRQLLRLRDIRLLCGQRRARQPAGAVVLDLLRV